MSSSGQGEENLSRGCGRRARRSSTKDGSSDQIIIPVTQLARTTAYLDEIILRCPLNRLLSLPKLFATQRVNMVGMAGFEPAASRLSAGCSSQAKLTRPERPPVRRY